MKRIAFLSTVLGYGLGCGGSTFSTPATPTASGARAATTATRAQSPAELLADLTALADGFSQSESTRCRDRCCLPHLPPWFEDSGDAGDVPRAELRRIVQGTSDPRVRGLALRWLARGANQDDVEYVAPFVDATLDAGPLPRVERATTTRCPPVQWLPAPLGGVALESLSTLTSVRFESPQAFRAWYAARTAR